MHKAKQIYLIFLISILLTACSRNKKIDVSNIPIDIHIERFDHDLDEMRTKPMLPQMQILQKKYGIFYQDYIDLLLQNHHSPDTSYFKSLHEVFTRTEHGRNGYLDLKHEVDSVYPGALDKQSEELTDAFRRIKYFVPRAKLPTKVYAYFSGFQAQTSLGDDYVGIGLDMFLGANSKFYPAIIEAFPRYVSRRFTPEYIAPKVAETILRENLFPENATGEQTLLAKMIYNGKIMYCMDLVLPDTPDSVKIGYTAPQMKWANDFKANIWGYFLEQNLLYNSDSQRTQMYIDEAPFTAGLGENNASAPKLGVWTGWQIVKQYMDLYPKVTLMQLMADDDAQKILNRSKYRPK